MSDAKPLDYHERRRSQDAARVRGELPECGRAACTAKADPAWVNSGTPLLYCAACARLINRYSAMINRHDLGSAGEPLCTPEVVATPEAT